MSSFSYAFRIEHLGSELFELRHIKWASVQDGATSEIMVRALCLALTRSEVYNGSGVSAWSDQHPPTHKVNTNTNRTQATN